MIPTTDLVARALSNARTPCITASFQADCVVLMHMVRVHRPEIPVLFIDTLHHFPETLRYRDQLVSEWRVNLVRVCTEAPLLGQWQVNTGACCARHKVGPLFAALRPYDTWFTALRREQSPSRADLVHEAPFRLPTGEVLTKVSPLADWTTQEVEDYARHHAIPLLPLYQQGFPSIGCEPCTQRPLDPTQPRSGRWSGRKLECGIHIEASRSVPAPASAEGTSNA